MSEDILDTFEGVGVKVALKNKEQFLLIKETLTRIGVSPKDQKILYQSCHIIHKNGEYAIAHFKELFALDDLPTNVAEEDLLRRNAIVNLLEQWGFLVVIDKQKVAQAMPLNGLKIIKFAEKQDWKLVRKFNPASLRAFFDDEWEDEND